MKPHYYFGHTDGVEVTVNGRVIDREKWMRYAVHREDVEKAKQGEETRYGCAGDVCVRPADVVAANLRAELVNVLRRSEQSLEAAYNVVCEYSEGRAASEAAQFIHADLEQVRGSLHALGVGSNDGR